MAGDSRKRKPEPTAYSLLTARSVSQVKISLCEGFTEIFTGCSGSLLPQHLCGVWFMSLFNLEMIVSTNGERYKIIFKNLREAAASGLQTAHSPVSRSHFSL